MAGEVTLAAGTGVHPVISNSSESAGPSMATVSMSSRNASVVTFTTKSPLAMALA